MKVQKPNNIEIAIIKTLSYADIFDFPMESFEIFKFLIGRKVPKQKLFEVLEQAVEKGLIARKNNFFYLHGRLKICQIRDEREKESRRKIEIAQKTAKILGLIPTVNLIGVSGSLSMRNSKKEDDIDFFIITQKNTLWITRFCISFMLLLVGKKRGRDDLVEKDKICPNMFLSENSLSLKKNKQNIFSAHEIAQLKVLVNKNKTYQKFLFKNKWIHAFIPNFNVPFSSKKNYQNSFILKFLNTVFFSIQYFYMKKKITNEEIGKGIARFHPKDKSKYIQELYKLRYENYLEFIQEQVVEREPFLKA